MTRNDDLTLAAHGDNAISITRSFAAPKAMLFDAWTKPELVRRWLLGPDGWTMPDCHIDLTVGGTYRYVLKHVSKDERVIFGGTFKEIARPDRLAATEHFEEPFFPGEAMNVTTFVEKNGRTIVTTISTHASKEARDGAMASGMEKGVKRSYDRLDEMLMSETTPR
jgi:uncharacterized protein YndB with AHSA1/START domain